MSARPAGAAHPRATPLGPKLLPLLLALACAREAGESQRARERERRPARPAARLDLRDFGARGDGMTDDGPALQRALEALKAAGGGALHVPAGRYAIASPVEVDFTGLDAPVEIGGVASDTLPGRPDSAGDRLSRGLDLPSELLPRTGAGRAIVLAGARRLTVRDLAFVGTPGVASDARVTLTLEGIGEARIAHCEFYGLGTMDGEAIVLAERSALSVERSVFLGVTTSSARNAPVIENLDWHAVSVSDAVFIDYGLRPELYSKTPRAPPSAWIGIGNAAPPRPDSPRREVVLRDLFFDEGALAGVASTPVRQGRPPSAPIDLFYASGVRMNVSNLRTSGFHLDGLERALVEDSHYGWSRNADAGIRLFAVREAILSRVSCIPRIPCLRGSGSTRRLWVLGSTGQRFEATAVEAEVVPGEGEQDDPVLYVRRRFERLARREPDPAAHFHWARRILLCRREPRCVAQRRAELAAYLASEPRPRFAIRGTVRDERGAPAAGVPVTLAGSQDVSTLTDAGGGYRFGPLPTSGVYLVRATPAGGAADSRRVVTPVRDVVADLRVRRRL